MIKCLLPCNATLHVATQKSSKNERKTKLKVFNVKNRIKMSTKYKVILS